MRLCAFNGVPNSTGVCRRSFSFSEPALRRITVSTGGQAVECGDPTARRVKLCMSVQRPRRPAGSTQRNRAPAARREGRGHAAKAPAHALGHVPGPVLNADPGHPTPRKTLVLIEIGRRQLADAQVVELAAEVDGRLTPNEVGDMIRAPFTVFRPYWRLVSSRDTRGRRVDLIRGDGPSALSPTPSTWRKRP